MACIGKIASNLAMACGSPGWSDLGRPVSARVLNASDIASYTVTTAGSAIIKRVSGARGWDITTTNNALVVTVGLKSQDIMPGAYDVAITFKSFSGTPATVSNPTPMGVVGTMERAELIFCVDHGDAIRVYGLGVPLVCTEISGDSSENERVTYTFGVEDWQVGTTIHYMTRESYNALSTPYTPPAPPTPET